MFPLTSEQNEIQELALKFSRNEIWPVAQQYDEESIFPTEIMQKAFELGLLNTSIPAQYGGAGFKHLEATIITEAIAYGCMGVNSSFLANDLALLPIVIAGTDEQKKKFLTPFTEELKIASFCLTEPSNGSDAAGIKTTFAERGNDLVINGNKMWITNAGYADLFVVYGTTDKNLRHKGISAVILDPKTDGVEIGKKEDKMGHRSSDTRSVSFNNVVVPKENILGKLNEGWKIAMKTLDQSRPLVAASSVGGAQCAFEHAVKYSLERKQFETPICDHQLIQKILAEMAMKIESARLLTHKAAHLLDIGQRNTKVASMAKAFASDMCMEVTTDAVQVYGGYGYSKEYPVEKLMRDAKLIQIYEGTSQIQRLVIAREVLKEYS